MKHGGDLLSYHHLYNGELIDFSSNINPLGYPHILDELFVQGMPSLQRYPDIQYRLLRDAIAAYLGCGTDEVLVGNGAVEILDYFCRTHERVVVCLPCFAEYLERPRSVGHQVRALRLPEDFVLRAALLEGQIQPGDVVMLGNPNNPTGRRIAQAELVRIQQYAETCGAMLVLDEAFFEFCPPDYDSIRLFHRKNNVCVIRAATKFFGIPGLRLGYAYAPESIAAAYDAAALPWRINAFADLAGQHIFQETAYIARSQQYIAEQRRWLLAQLKAVQGITAYPTDANFILLRLRHCTEEELFQALIRQGILIRKASSFEGLDEHYVRLALKDRDSNQKLITALQRVFTQENAAKKSDIQRVS